MNQVFLSGFLGRDPSVHQFEDGQLKAEFPLATNRREFTTSSGRVVPEETTWHNVECYHSLAVIAQKYLRKASKIALQGHIASKERTLKDGSKRTFVVVVADSLEFLSTGKSDPLLQQTSV